MKHFSSLFMIITIFFFISCEKNQPLEIPNEIVGIWQFDSVLDAFGGTSSIGTANLHYKNYHNLNLEFKSDYKYLLHGNDPQYIINSGAYRIREDKIYISQTLGTLYENEEFLKILESSDTTLTVSHSQNIRLNGEEVIVFISKISFSRVK